MANVDIVADENMMNIERESVDTNMCKGTCTLGSSGKGNRVCVDVGEEEPLVFGKCIIQLFFTLSIPIVSGLSHCFGHKCIPFETNDFEPAELCR